MKGKVILSQLDSLIGYSVHAEDGEIGTLEDIYFDDEKWGIRYAVIKAGGTLDAKGSLLLSPISFKGLDHDTNALMIALSCEDVAAAPRKETDKPVSRQFEEKLHAHFSWPIYWPPNLYYGYNGYIPPLVPGNDAAGNPREEVRNAIAKTEAHEGDNHLRSYREVKHYTVATYDGEIGEAVNMLYNDIGWYIEYFVIDTGSWLPGKKILLPAGMIPRIRYSGGRISALMRKDVLKNAPEYDPDKPVLDTFVEQLFEYFDTVI